MKKYFLTIDSLPHADTLDLNFKLLKAYYNNDTTYLIQSNNEMAALLKYKSEMIESHICEELPFLNSFGFEEAYRFSYEAAFCNKAVNMTIGKSTAGVIMDFILYEFNEKETECQIINHFTKELDNKEWNNLIEGLKYADFWGLKEDNGIHGFDGSSLRVTGYKKPKNAFRGSYKSIYRWSAEKSAIGSLFQRLLNLSGIKVQCFHY